MSKAQLKKQLLSLTKEQLVDQILELYESFKPVKEFYSFYLNPNEKELCEKYKDIIIKEFYPKGKYAQPKTRLAVAKKAIAEFSAFKPSPELIGDLMITFSETACKFTFDYGDLWEQYYTSAVTNFERALKFLHKNNLLPQFKLRCETCLKYTESCGYNFPGEMQDVFNEYYPE
jgi:hypothetical protein